MWPIFEGGKIRANIRSSEEAELQAYFGYGNAALGALRDVEDALARCADDARHLRAIEEAESAASSSSSIVRRQYEKGIVKFTNVLNAETSLLTARDQIVQDRQALAQEFGGLFQALGGGWD